MKVKVKECLLQDQGLNRAADHHHDHERRMIHSASSFQRLILDRSWISLSDYW